MSTTKTNSTFPSDDQLAQRLREDVERISLPYGRVVGSDGHAEAEAYLHQRLQEIGCEPYRGESIRLPYKSEGEAFVNLIGRIPGRNGTGKAPLLIGAHYDSVIDAPCADDNAAAVAIALAVGHAAAQSNALERDLIIAIFDSEEPPYFQSASMGSNYFAKRQMLEPGIHAAIVMDLVGHDVPGFPGFDDLLFVTGAESHPELAEVFNHSPHPVTLKILPTLNSYVGDMSDHGAFRKRGIPYFFLSCGHWEHYHRTTDTPDRLNYLKMAAITKLSCDFLQGLDASQLGGSRQKENLCDTVDFEIRCMRAAFGPALPMLLAQADIEELNTRDDIDWLVNSLKRALGL